MKIILYLPVFICAFSLLSLRCVVLNIAANPRNFIIRLSHLQQTFFYLSRLVIFSKWMLHLIQECNIPIWSTYDLWPQGQIIQCLQDNFSIYMILFQIYLCKSCKHEYLGLILVWERLNSDFGKFPRRHLDLYFILKILATIQF